MSQQKLKLFTSNKKRGGVQNVNDSVLLGRRDMRAMVMHCGYTVMLTSFRESFMGSGREKETHRSQHPEKIRRSFHLPLIKSNHTFFILWFPLPKFTIKEKRVH